MSLIVIPGGSGPTRTLHVRGEVDVATAPLLERHLSASIQLRPHRIAIDAREIAFLGCAGIRVLRGAAKEAQRVSLAPLLILHPQPQVLRVLTLTEAVRWLDLRAPGPADPLPKLIDITVPALMGRLQEAQAAIDDAADHCDVLRWERARLDFAAVAFWSCEQLSARGLSEPDGLRDRALAILGRAEGTLS